MASSISRQYPKPERIFIHGTEVVGVHGSSAFHIEQCFGNSYHYTPTPLATYIAFETVTELWLSSLDFVHSHRERPVAAATWFGIFERMSSVKMLVLPDTLRDRTYSLKEVMKNLVSYFPSLTELHVQEYKALPDSDLDWLLQSLKLRQ